MPYIRNIIKHLNKKKYLIIVVSNQSGVGRGYYPKKNVKNIENFIKRNLRIDAFYYAYYYKNSQNDLLPILTLFSIKQCEQILQSLPMIAPGKTTQYCQIVVLFPIELV